MRTVEEVAWNFDPQGMGYTWIELGGKQCYSNNGKLKIYVLQYL